MNPTVPTADDKPLFDLWLSAFWLPTVIVATDVGVFEELALRPATDAQLALRLRLNARATKIILALLASLALLDLRQGQYALTTLSRNYLLKNSRFFWGGVFKRMRESLPQCQLMQDVLTVREKADVAESRSMKSWASGQLDMRLAREIADFMQGTSAAAAGGVAADGDFSGVRRLLDVGAGSGCFSIALAQRHPAMHCTMMDLEGMCTVAMEAVRADGLADRVDARAVDMLREPWPPGYDAIFFSNIFHDWTDDICRDLARKAFAALPGGGSIYIHEVLMDDAGTGPLSAAAFSVQMLMATQGRQFTFAELRGFLEGAGFVAIEANSAYGYHSLIRGIKP